MRSYVTILRGINVGGKNLIRMADLRKELTNLTLYNIQTYIQSGNIVFQANSNDPSELQLKIHHLIKAKWGFDVPVIAITGKEFSDIIMNHFCQKDSSFDPAYSHITFLSEPHNIGETEKIENNKSPGEVYKLSDRAVYLYFPAGYGKTKLDNSFFEKTLGVTATTRNYRTSMKLLEMVGNMN